MFSGARCIFAVAIVCSGGCDVRAGCCLVVGCAREVLRVYERGTEVRSRARAMTARGRLREALVGSIVRRVVHLGDMRDTEPRHGAAGV